MGSYNNSPRLHPYVGALVCFGVAILGLVYAILHREAPGQLFPFIETGIVVAFTIWGMMCVYEAVGMKKDPPRALSADVIGLLVAISTCSLLLGVIVDAKTQGMGWKEVPATVTGVPFYPTSRGRRHYTVQYQYAWHDQTFNGATEANQQPSITFSSSTSFEMRPLRAGDAIQIKMNSERPEQSLFPQSLSFFVYIAFLIFFLLGVFSFRRWRNESE